ncbi:hypothetical protein VT84_09265 [Gemmata sp. SH-PL17]|uniref:hypothetical protein n=1 Tax=Gemmata sp. SH-PL17 TaxID=1630693 RepID=UPI00078D7CBD|nr:hypothetical protein [Gemmata sp. SH-PL17]AMV24572.1 hypothetical protein VT84_09265 [Gemmata sp. SH-PL17]
MVATWLCVILCVVTLCVGFFLGIAFVMLASMIADHREFNRKHDEAFANSNSHSMPRIRI